MSDGTTGRNLERIAAVDSNVRFDLRTKRKVQWTDTKMGQTYYPGSNQEENWDVVEKEVLVRKRRRDFRDKDVFAFSTANGQGRQEMEDYKDLPAEDQDRAIRDRILSGLEFAGIAVTNFEASTSDRANSGFVASWGGLNTIFCYHHSSPGDILRVDLPDKDHLDKFWHSKPNRRGVPRTKFEFITRPLRPQDAGESLRIKLCEVITNSAMFERTMGGREIQYTNAWLSACRRTFQSDMFTAVAVVYADRKAQGDDDAAAFNAVRPLAQRLGLLTDNQTNAQKRTRVLVANTLYNCKNGAFRIGGRVGVFQSGNVNLNTEAGRLVQMQQNHFVQKVSAFHEAILDDHRWVVGTVIRGGKPGGTQDIVQGLGKA